MTNIYNENFNRYSFFLKFLVEIDIMENDKREFGSQRISVKKGNQFVLSLGKIITAVF